MGGTAHSARWLAVEEHAIIKTLIMEEEHHQPLIVLMHGDRKVSTKELARLLNVKAITPCDPAVANKTQWLPGRWNLAVRHSQTHGCVHGNPASWNYP
jgi:hypothetical protein